MSLAREKLPEMLSKQDVAALLDVNVKTVERRIATGALPAHRFGRLVRISSDDYRAFVAQQRLWLAKAGPVTKPDERPTESGSVALGLTERTM